MALTDPLYRELGHREVRQISQSHMVIKRHLQGLETDFSRAAIKL